LRIIGVLILFLSLTNGSGFLPSAWGVDWLAESLQEHPRVFAYFIVTVLGLILASCMVAGYWGDKRFHQELARQIQLRPPRDKALPGSTGERERTGGTPDSGKARESSEA
jgi:hypothetical protein